MKPVATIPQEYRKGFCVWCGGRCKLDATMCDPCREKARTAAEKTRLAGWKKDGRPER